MLGDDIMATFAGNESSVRVFSAEAPYNGGHKMSINPKFMKKPNRPIATWKLVRN